MRFRSVHAVAFILLSAYCLIGCDFAVFDDLVSCPQGVSFHFYRQTPCEQFPNYPSDIRQVRVFAFDANGVLVGEFSDKKVLLSADYSLSATFRINGNPKGSNTNNCNVRQTRNKRTAAPSILEIKKNQAPVRYEDMPKRFSRYS